MKKTRFSPRPHHIPFVVFALAAIIMSAGLVVTLLQKTAPATTGNIYLASKTAAAKTGEDVSFVVRISPGTTIDTVTATASYDSNVLTFKKATYADSPFSSQIPATQKGNTLTVQAAKLGGKGIKDDSYIATLVFTAKKQGTVNLKLIDGNAALAGVATHPTIDGKVVETPPSTVTASGSGSQSGGNSPATTSPAIFRPAQALLSAVGLSTTTAARVAPWLTGLVICIVLAAVTLVVLLIYRHRRNNKKESSHVIQPPSN